MLKAAVEQQLLSYHFQLGKKVIKNNKLNLFGKTISVLDRVKTEKQQLESISEIDLSHNTIDTIQDVGMFRNVEIINLCHNRLSCPGEILKLNCLPRLHTLLIKKNPFLKEKLSDEQTRFLLSLETDVTLASEYVHKKIAEIVTQKTQLICYSNYLNKMQMHVQLGNQHQVKGNNLKSEGSQFPKIKKMFQSCFEKNIKIRRQIVSQIEKKIFSQEKTLTEFLEKELEVIKMSRNKVIKTIYEVEQRTKSQRGSQLEQLKGHIMIEEEQEQPEQYNFENVLKEHKRSVNLKMRNVVQNLKRSRHSNQNYPFEESLEMSDDKTLQQFQHQFMTILCKINPLYHLLRSPIASLKGSEKELLIQSLLGIVKEKMKENFKLQKIHKEDSALKSEFQALQEHLEVITTEVRQQKQATTDKIKKLTKLCTEESQKSEELEDQLIKYKQYMEEERKQNIILVKRREQQDRYFSKMQKQEQLQEIISIKRQKTLLQKTMILLIKKASHFSKIQMLRDINEKVINKELKQIGLFAFRTNRDLNRYTKQLNFYLMRQKGKQFMNVLLEGHDGFTKQRNLSKFLIRKQKLNKMMCFRQTVKNRKKEYQKLLMFRIKRHLATKQSCMEVFKELLVQKNEEQLSQWIDYQRNCLLTHKMFRTWRKDLANHASQSQTVKNWVETQHKTSGFRRLSSQCSKAVAFRIHVDALESFLIAFRKFNGYIRFTKTISRKLFSRQINCSKIKTIRQYRFFEQFVAITKNQVMKKRIRMEEQRHRQERIIKEAESLLESNAQVKRNKLIRFKGNLRIISVSVRRNMMIRCQKSSTLKKQKDLNKMRFFYSELRSNVTKRVKLECKISLLMKSSKFVGSIRYFYSLLANNQSKVEDHIEIKEKKNKITYFYRWKAFALWQRMQTYRLKFEELGPQLNKVSLFQKELSEEKELLKEELSYKQNIIEDYIKKCGQYEYSLYSKDVKYDKLKNIYEQIVQTSQLGNTIKRGTEGTFQKYRPIKDENLYLKYLPSDIRNQHYAKSKADLDDQQLRNTIRDRLKTTNEYILEEASISQPLDYSYDYTDKRRSNTLEQPQFVSSFKRF